MTTIIQIDKNVYQFTDTQNHQTYQFQTFGQAEQFIFDSRIGDTDMSELSKEQIWAIGVLQAFTDMRKAVGAMGPLGSIWAACNMGRHLVDVAEDGTMTPKDPTTMFADTEIMVGDVISATTMWQAAVTFLNTPFVEGSTETPMNVMYRL